MVTEKGITQRDLSKYLQQRYSLATGKAMSIARRETSLLLSEYRKNKLEQVGAKRFLWSTAKNKGVRSSHQEPHGKIFSFSEPPEVDGKPRLLGMDFSTKK
jgi:SPP1 gp7 family putative phage head morphogenesis protein